MRKCVLLSPSTVLLVRGSGQGWPGRDCDPSSPGDLAAGLTSHRASPKRASSIHPILVTALLETPSSPAPSEAAHNLARPFASPCIALHRSPSLSPSRAAAARSWSRAGHLAISWSPAISVIRSSHEPQRRPDSHSSTLFDSPAPAPLPKPR